MRKLLLIAGMGQSVALARELCALQCYEVTCITQGRAVARAEPPAIVHDAPFVQDADFLAFLQEHQFDWVIDASHPFEARLGALAHAQMTATKRGEYLRVTRAPWVPLAHETWTNIPTLTQAIAQIKQNARVFIATGRGSLEAFQSRPDLYVMCRQLKTHAHPFPLQNGRFVFGEGPFGIQEEIDTFTSLQVDYLLLRNSGSIAGRSKVDAACACGVEVLMIAPRTYDLAQEKMVGFDRVIERVKRDAID